jgi:chromosomal replication initiation ATPase DnaA
MTLHLESDPRNAPPLARQAYAEHIARQSRLWPVPKRRLPAREVAEIAVEPEPIPDPFAEKFIASHRDLVERRKSPFPIDIQRAVAIHFGISVEDLLGPRRSPVYSIPRFVAVYLTSVLCPKLSLPQIGRFFSGRDHSTICNSIRQINRLLSDERLPGNTEMTNKIATIRAEIEMPK